MYDVLVTYEGEREWGLCVKQLYVRIHYHLIIYRKRVNSLTDGK